MKTIIGATSEYLVIIVLDLMAHIFLKNEECTGINYREWLGIPKFSPVIKRETYHMLSSRRFSLVNMIKTLSKTLEL